MSTGETVLANLGPVCLWLGTCPSIERSNLAAKQGLPGVSPSKGLGAKASGGGGCRGGPCGQSL